jgi:hypothetical protein
LAEALAVSQDARCKRGAGPYPFSTLFLASQRKDRFTVSPFHRCTAFLRAVDGLANRLATTISSPRSRHEMSVLPA